MDSLVSEKSIAFGEPPVYSSRDFVTVQTTERPSEPGLWHKAGSRFAISLRNIAQNELLDTNNMALQFSVVSVVEPKANATGIRTNVALPMSNAKSAAVNMPGTPAFGCPFFSTVQVAIPGLGLESFLRADGESQSIVASRLMCSAGVGAFSESQGRLGYSISGKAFDAGARDVASRAECVFSEGFITDRKDNLVAVAPGATESLLESVFGTITHYSVPLSLFTHLSNGLSSMLPLSYFAAGGDLLTATFTLAPASTALNQTSIDRSDLVGPSTYYVIDPALSFTKTQINNPSVLASIESLYRGVSSIPIAPGISAPMAMTLKDIDYSTAYTSIQGPVGAFQVTIPANEPSMRGVLLKFSCDDFKGVGLKGAGGDYSVNSANDIGTQWNGKHAFTLEPLIRNLVLRIGSYRVPLDAISDIRYDPTAIQGLNGVNPFATIDPTKNATLIDCLSTRREAARMYSQGKHLFSPFMANEQFEDDALAPFWAAPASRQSSASAAFFGIPSSVKYRGRAIAGEPDLYGLVSQPRILSGDSTTQRIAYCTGPGMFVIPFESFAAVLNHRSDAFALRGLDLRSITSISISGEIVGVASGAGPGEAPQLVAQASTSGWTVRALAAYDREIVLLPGRVDTSAQFSLIPTSSGVTVPTM